jgi:hypothetical protein
VNSLSIRSAELPNPWMGLLGKTEIGREKMSKKRRKCGDN